MEKKEEQLWSSYGKLKLTENQKEKHPWYAPHMI